MARHLNRIGIMLRLSKRVIVAGSRSVGDAPMARLSSVGPRFWGAPVDPSSRLIRNAIATRASSHVCPLPSAIPEYPRRHRALPRFSSHDLSPSSIAPASLSRANHFRIEHRPLDLSFTSLRYFNIRDER